MNTTLTRVLSFVIALIVPFFLIMTAIRLLFTPLYPQIEYRMPGFPADAYGFSLQDRLRWATVSIDYLLNDAGIEYLANQRLPEGGPLYNERELSHMVDVKLLVQRMVTAWTILLAVLSGLGVWAWRARWLPVWIHALGNGGKLTVGLIVLILAGVAISFNALFTGFHQIFFTGGSWLFYYTDTLIRLFPLRFWQDGFIFMGMFTLLGSVLLIWLDRKF